MRMDRHCHCLYSIIAPQLNCNRIGAQMPWRKKQQCRRPCCWQSHQARVGVATGQTKRKLKGSSHSVRIVKRLEAYPLALSLTNNVVVKTLHKLCRGEHKVAAKLPEVLRIAGAATKRWYCVCGLWMDHLQNNTSAVRSSCNQPVACHASRGIAHCADHTLICLLMLPAT